MFVFLYKYAYNTDNESQLPVPQLSLRRTQEDVKYVIGTDTASSVCDILCEPHFLHLCNI